MFGPEQSKYPTLAVLISNSSYYLAFHAELLVSLRGWTDLWIRLSSLIPPPKTEGSSLCHIFPSYCTLGQQSSQCTMMVSVHVSLPPAGGQVL